MSSVNAIGNEIYKNISNEKETNGFDFSAGANWIYPLNYPIRDYQFNIVKNALFENTLVSLPTGLGKTFIAAVIMYNYFRWYPNGKIIFMAPTKPLVRQQIDACYNIVGIPKETTVELTGTIAQATRVTLWRDKRVFFITPHVLQNDLENMPEIVAKIKCLVLDEAHKAKGTYAYCEVMRKLQERNKYFRVLALSATPGGNVREILKIAQTLCISHLEFKTDESPDVAPYVYKRVITTVHVPLDKKLLDVREEYLKIIEQYARILIQNKVFTGNYSQLTKGRIFMTLKDYQARKTRNVNIPNYNNIMKSLNICLTLYHGLELLTKHGLRGFLLFYKEHIEKPLLRGNQSLHSIINDLTEYLGPLPDLHNFPDGNIPQLPKNIRFGHPKFRKLGDVLSSHFLQNDTDSTRAIVFFEYKDSVLEAHALLLEYHPLIRAKAFVGQSFITQKQQKTTLNLFRTGDCNTLLSTSIGEEGLDVGEVDLIVCFDINSKSSIRMVQRMGRTGRKREGKIVVLITEGKEEELFRECLVEKRLLNESILNCSDVHAHLYGDSPKMVPDGLVPLCKKVHITVRKEEKPVENTTTKIGAKKNAIKTMFESQEISSVVYSEVEDKIPEVRMLCLEATDTTTKSANQKIDFSNHLENQRSRQSRFLIDQSRTSNLLRSILEFADLKRFNIPQAQIDRLKYAKTGAGLHQTDIRSMFSKQQQIPISQLEIDSNLNEKLTEMLFENKQFEASNDLQTEIRDYLTITYSNMFHCEMCDKNTQICNLFKTDVSKNDSNFNVLSWIQPDNRIFDYLNKDTLNKFVKCDDEFISTDIFDFECSTKQHLDSAINLIDSFKADDFFSEDFIEDIFQQSELTSQIVIKLESTSPCKQLENNSLISLDDEFVSSDILDEFNFNLSGKENPLRKTPTKLFDNYTANKTMEDIFNKKSSTNLSVNVNKSLTMGRNLEVDKKINTQNSSDENCKLASINDDDDEFMDLPSILAEISKQICSLSSISDSEDQNCLLNQAFSLPNKSQFRSDCASPDLFSDSDSFTPEIDDDSNDRTILLSQNQSNNKNQSNEATILRSPISPAKCAIKSTENKSPSLWNLSKIYTQTCKDISLSCASDEIDLLCCTHESLNIVSEVPMIEARKTKVKRKLSLNSSFLDAEALQDGTQSADEDEIDLLDEYEASFVNDSSQDVGNSTALHAFYLKTTRSPINKQKGFKIPSLPKMDKMDIYSQIEPTQNDTYLEDSFCVDILTQDITKDTEFDVLDEAEAILKSRKRRKNSDSEQINRIKRRRLRVLSDSD